MWQHDTVQRKSHKLCGVKGAHLFGFRIDPLPLPNAERGNEIMMRSA